MRGLLFGSSFGAGFDSSVDGSEYVLLRFTGCLARLVFKASFCVAFSTAWWMLEMVNCKVVTGGEGT